jgi:hypothetical protein
MRPASTRVATVTITGTPPSGPGQQPASQLTGASPSMLASLARTWSARGC